jgi:hypothetical protein
MLATNGLSNMFRQKTMKREHNLLFLGDDLTIGKAPLLHFPPGSWQA